MTEGGKNTARSCQFEVFSFVNEHNNTNTKSQGDRKEMIFKVIPEDKQQLEEKDADINTVFIRLTAQGAY